MGSLNDLAEILYRVEEDATERRCPKRKFYSHSRRENLVFLIDQAEVDCDEYDVLIDIIRQQTFKFILNREWTGENDEE